jgi:Suppressor of fused protein (SUFU)
MKEELIIKFGAENVSLHKKINDSFEILQLKINLKSPVVLLITHGLSNYEMPVHEMYAGRERNELFFCLPSYWDLEDPTRQWTVLWLEKLMNYVVDKRLWFGPGHTIQCYKDFSSLSEKMKPNHLMLVDPILLDGVLTPIRTEEKTVYFLGVMPIFSDEMEYKQTKGTQKLLNKFEQKNVDEKLDEFRETVLKSRWKLR